MTPPPERACPFRLPSRRVVLHLAIAVTLTATAIGSSARSRYERKVVARERVPANAVRFPSILGRRPSPTQQVLSVRDRLKMLRIDARRVAARVIEFTPARNRTDQASINEAVGPFARARAVAVAFDVAGPRPALIRPAPRRGDQRRDSLLPADSRHAGICGVAVDLAPLTRRDVLGIVLPRAAGAE